MLRCKGLLDCIVEPTEDIRISAERLPADLRAHRVEQRDQVCSWQGVVFLVGSDFKHDLVAIESFLHVDSEDNEVIQLSLLYSEDVFRKGFVSTCARR